MEELSMEDNLGLSYPWVFQFDFGVKIHWNR